MIRRIVTGLCIGAMLILATALVAFEIVAPCGKEEKLVLSGAEPTGRPSWELGAAARGVIFNRYSYFSTPIAIPAGIDRRTWEQDLAEDNVGLEYHALWSVERRIPVFPKDRPTFGSVSYRDLFLGYRTEYEIKSEAIVVPGAVGLGTVILSAIASIRRRKKNSAIS